VARGTVRDPVSVQFDEAAARLLRRAYDLPRGTWAGTYVRNPSPSWMAWGAAHGMSLLGPDNAPGGQARTRWCRAFVRSCFYLHRWYYYPGDGLRLGDRRASPWGRPLQYQVGTVRITPAGLIVGRAVRVRTQAGGQKAADAAAALPDSRRIYTDDGQPGGRYSSIAGRDW
jgi:hypothetical protein